MHTSPCKAACRPFTASLQGRHSQHRPSPDNRGNSRHIGNKPTVSPDQGDLIMYSLHTCSARCFRAVVMKRLRCAWQKPFANLPCCQRLKRFPSSAAPEGGGREAYSRQPCEGAVHGPAGHTRDAPLPAGGQAPLLPRQERHCARCARAAQGLGFSRVSRLCRIFLAPSKSGMGHGSAMPFHAR